MRGSCQSRAFPRFDPLTLTLSLGEKELVQRFLGFVLEKTGKAMVIATAMRDEKHDVFPTRAPGFAFKTQGLLPTSLSSISFSMPSRVQRQPPRDRTLVSPRRLSAGTREWSIFRR